MRLETENGTKLEVSTEAELSHALASLGADTNTFAILASDDEQYIQTVSTDEGFIIERRDGSFDRHYRIANGSQTTFTLHEVVQIFAAYLGGAPMPSHFIQQPMNMPQPGSIHAVAQSAKGYALIGLLLAGVIAVAAWRWYLRGTGL